MEVIPLKIAERLEKYPLFEGLSCLQAVKITWESGEQIPQTGEVGEVLKSGDTLLCDLTSKDLWLTVRVDVPSLTTILHLDIKVDCDATVSCLRLTLLRTALELLHLPTSPGTYSPEDLHLTQIPQSSHLLNVYSPVHSLSEGCTLEPQMHIRDCFDFISCYVSGHLLLRAEIQTWETNCDSPEIRTQPAIRKVHIEDLASRRSVKHPITLTKAEGRCVGCVIC